MGKTLEEALRWGPVNAMSVTQKVGAQKGLLTVPEIEALLAHAPATFTATSDFA